MKNKSQYKLWFYEPLSGGSINSDKSGLTPKRAKYNKHFLNPETGQVLVFSDIDTKIRNRNKKLLKFEKTYSNLFKQKKVSILAFVVDEKDYPKLSKFFNNIDKKLKRINVKRLAYVWVRDVGEKRAEPHFHILISTSRINETEFKKLCSKRTAKYEVNFVKTKRGLISYLRDKEVFGKENQRTFGQSASFDKPLINKEIKLESKYPLYINKSLLINSIEQEIKSLKYKKHFQQDKKRANGASRHFKET